MKRFFFLFVILQAGLLIIASCLAVLFLLLQDNVWLWSAYGVIGVSVLFDVVAVVRIVKSSKRHKVSPLAQFMRSIEGGMENE